MRKIDKNKNAANRRRYVLKIALILGKKLPTTKLVISWRAGFNRILAGCNSVLYSEQFNALVSLVHLLSRLHSTKRQGVQ